MGGKKIGNIFILEFYLLSLQQCQVGFNLWDIGQHFYICHLTQSTSVCGEELEIKSL